MSQKLATSRYFGAAASVIMNVAPDASLIKQRSEIVGFTQGSEGLPTGIISKHSGLLIYGLLSAGCRSRRSTL